MMRIKEIINQNIEIHQQILSDEKLLDKISSSAALIVDSLKNGGKIHFCGNGGSAADAQHLAAELSGRYYIDRPPLNAEAMHVNSSYVTAVANDYGYDHIYSRLLAGTGKEGDVLVAISTSGNAANIIQACRKAREMKISVVSFTGETGGMLKGLSDILINIPSMDTPRIQEAHIMTGHIICEMVESELFSHLKH